MNESEPKGAIALASVDTKAAVQHSKSSQCSRSSTRAKERWRDESIILLQRQQNGRQRV